MKNQKGVTLVALVVTIIVLIILAGITISITMGDNGIITKAKEAKKTQIIADAKEKIGIEILSAQMDAIERNEELEQVQVEDIISNYGTLQDDKDTIVLKDNEYEISLLEIYQGTTTSTGSYTESKAKTELLEGQVKRLQEQLNSMSQTGDEKDKKIAELNEKVTAVENEKAVLQNENSALSSKVDEVTKEVKTIKQEMNTVNSNLTENNKAFKNYVITENFEGTQVNIGHTGYKFNEQDIEITTPTGYKPIYATGLSTNTGQCGFATCYLVSNTKVHVTLFNASESIDENPIPVIKVVYIRDM